MTGHPHSVTHADSRGCGCQPGPNHVLAGLYRHYKGGIYQVLGLGFDANIDGRTTVIYIPLYLSEGQPGPRLTVRTVEDFFGEIDPDTGMLWHEHCDFMEAEGQECVCDGPVKRFTYLGATYTP